MSGTNEIPQKRALKLPLPLRLALIAIAAAILMPGLAVLALHIPAVQSKIIAGAATRIEEATRLKVELESFTWRPISQLRLVNLKLRAEGGKILDCENASINYSLILNRPYVKLEEIYLEKPFLRFERSADGKWLVPVNRPGPPTGKPAASGSAGISPPLPTVRIFSGTIEGRQQDRVVLSVKDITGVIHLKTVQGPGGPEIRIDLDSRQTLGHIGDHPK